MFKRPNPGQVVTVTTQYPSNLLNQEFDTRVYENVTVVPSFPWCSNSEFCIPAENEPYITQRTINMKSVIALEIEGGETETTINGVNYIQVPGSKGNEYTVTVEDGAGSNCECMGFQFRKRCRHLAEAEEILNGLLTQG